jgi:excisionase family DNA binding protein
MMASTSEQSIPADRLCTVAAIAAHLSLSRSTIYLLMDRGQLPYVKLGKSRRIRWSDVRDLIDRCRVGGSKC